MINVSPDTLDVLENCDSAVSTVWYDSLVVCRSGVSGEIISTPLASDTVIGIILLACAVFSFIFAVGAAPFTSYQFANLLRRPREDSAKLREAIGTKDYLRYFTPQSILLSGILAYAYFSEAMGVRYYASIYTIMGIYCLIVGGCMFMAYIARMLVQFTYFERSQRVVFNTEHRFCMALCGALLLPISIAYIYLGLSAQIMLYLIIVTSVFVKLLEFYKVFCIFFRKNASILQFFLYLCTLEAVPIALFVVILITATNILKINI